MARVKLQSKLAEQPHYSEAALVTLEAQAGDAPYIQNTLDYLASAAASQSIDANLYWPKWDSPWWHLGLIHEMGLSHRLPAGVARHLARALKEQNLPLFFQDELPPDRDPKLDTPCPCSLGNIYQILSGAGVDVDHEVPWARPWLLRYQLSDGGFNCDEDACRATPPASSMVGTIAPLEALLYCTSRPFTADEERFLDLGAQCLISRQLRRGCEAPFNAEERLDEADWLKPCFPRFYLYDVLRGLRFVLAWAETRKKPLAAHAIADVVASFCQRFPDGKIRIERHSYEGVGTRTQAADGQWQRLPEALHFALLTQVSQLGRVSPYLTRHWQQARTQLSRLLELQLVI